MDPVSAIGLASSCIGLVAKIGSTAKGVSDFVTHVKEANKLISSLASRLGILEIVVDELQRWLNRNPCLEPLSQVQLALAIDSCDVIVSDIANIVAKVKPQPGEKTSGFKQKIRLIWNNSIIKEHHEALSHSLQAFQILVQLTQRVDRRDGSFDGFIETSETKPAILQSSLDVRSILAATDTQSHESTLVDDGCNLEVELTIDEEIARSGPYIRQYRKLLLQQYEGGSRASPPAGEGPAGAGPSEQQEPVRHGRLPAEPLLRDPLIGAAGPTKPELSGISMDSFLDGSGLEDGERDRQSKGSSSEPADVGRYGQEPCSRYYSNDEAVSHYGRRPPTAVNLHHGCQPPPRPPVYAAVVSHC